MNPITIIKIGGKLLDEDAKLNQVIEAFTKIDTPKILVHGGGNKTSSLCRKLGIEPQLVDGRRITDFETMEVATMVYAGLINKKLVSRLQRYKCNAVGFSGADGNLLLAEKRQVKDIRTLVMLGDICRVI
ncbi:UNVERIFIED_CONTAM: hypothetical protein GTU68_013685 [Idotea baltica]|nr:hypothetical protein [Idotea baltica]